MEVRYLESVAGEHVSRATRFNGPGWYVLDDQGTLRRVLSGDVSVRGVMGYV